MQDISLHLLDIIENSIRAEAANVDVSIEIDKRNNRLKLRVSDDGHGMDEDMAANSQNPFYTTKNDRVKKVGLGIPLFKQNAELCEGSFKLISKKDEGTTIIADFRLDHIDRMPLGNVADTLLTSILGHPEADISFSIKVNDSHDGEDVFSFDMKEIKKELDGIPLSHPEVTSFIRNFLTDGISKIYSEEI